MVSRRRYDSKRLHLGLITQLMRFLEHQKRRRTPALIVSW